MEEYQTEVMQVSMDFLSIFSLAIGLFLREENFDENNDQIFQLFFSDPTTIIRLLHYSNEPSIPEEGIGALDYGMIILLLTDDNPGLQVKLADSWMDVPPQRGALL
ncbi:hypothetical protein ACHAW6_000017 [Cyclotella cf. meneghiniana]